MLQKSRAHERTAEGTWLLQLRFGVVAGQHSVIRS